MAFKESVRLEQIYFKNLQTMVGTLKAWKGATTSEELNDVIDSCIAANNAILLLYKNIGECWNDAVSLIVKNQEELAGLKTELASYHTEINEKIDDVNNYLMNLIRELQEAVGILQKQIQYRSRIVAWNEDEVLTYQIPIEQSQISGTNYDEFFYDSARKHLNFVTKNSTSMGLVPDNVNCIRVGVRAIEDSPTQAANYFIKAVLTVNVQLSLTDEVDYYNHEIDSGFQKTFTVIFKHEYNAGTAEGSNSLISQINSVDIQLPCTVGQAKQMLNVDSPLIENAVLITVAGDLEFIDGSASSWMDSGEDGIELYAEGLVKPSMNTLD